MKIFLDTEFTGLHQASTLISLAMVAEDGREFYAEFDDYDATQITPWLEEHVMAKLNYTSYSGPYVNVDKNQTNCKGGSKYITDKLKQWIDQFSHIEMWADVLAYDWVLFCELFGGALNLPPNIFFAPFDLSTLFLTKGLILPAGQYKGDINRFEFVDYDNNHKHHALHDARAEMLCFKKLMEHVE